MAKVFVSYARDDSRKTKRIIKKLIEYGFEFWMDTRNLKSGDDWSEEIIKAISDCNKFLLFMSAASMSSENVEREVHSAFKKKKKIIIIRLDDSKVPISLDYQIGRIQWTDYLSHDWERNIVSALGDGSKHYQKQKPPDTLSYKHHQRVQKIPKKPRNPQKILMEVEYVFSINGKFHKDQCDAAILKLDEFLVIVENHWINPAFAYNELVPRQHVISQLDVIKGLIQEFQETCPPGSSSKRQVIQFELKALIQEFGKVNK